MPLGPDWTRAQEILFTSMWPQATIPELLATFQGRSYNALSQKAKELRKRGIDVPRRPQGRPRRLPGPTAKERKRLMEINRQIRNIRQSLSKLVMQREAERARIRIRLRAEAERAYYDNENLQGPPNGASQGASPTRGPRPGSPVESGASDKP